MIGLVGTLVAIQSIASDVDAIRRNRHEQEG